MSVLRQAVKQLITACLPAERWLVRGRHAHGIDGSAISLTFDDGPHPEITPQVLDRLQTFGWKGTFFVIGSKAEQYPDVIRRIVAEGHEIGNHSWSHSEPSQTSARLLLDEVTATNRLLQHVAGKAAGLMRPPKGELTWNKIYGLWRAGQTIALWNVDPKDYRPDCQIELLRWAAEYEPAHGDIVLLHDAHPNVLTVLDSLQEHRRLVGAETVTLSTWLHPAASQPGNRPPRDRHHSESEEMPCP